MHKWLIKDKSDANIQRVSSHGKYISGSEIGQMKEKLSGFVDAKSSITSAKLSNCFTIRDENKGALCWNVSMA